MSHDHSKSGKVRVPKEQKKPFQAARPSEVRVDADGKPLEPHHVIPLSELRIPAPDERSSPLP